MKSTIWKNKGKVTVYIGGDPAKGVIPEITVEMDKPQIQIDSETNVIIIQETK